jgi:endogenous inhibitor of DNA gyrase (YacG/DUF329 family)
MIDNNTEGDDCPECGTTMTRKGLSGTDLKGRDVGVTWERCPTCRTYVDEFGEVVTPEEQQQRLEEAKEIENSVDREG